MLIDVDTLNEADLIDLNRRVVERLRFLHQARAHAGMLNFAIGEPVSFPNEHGVRIQGIVTRYNKKTVSILTTCGHRWNVSPHLVKSERMNDPADPATFAALIPPKG